ncbi:hypothetical protein WN943_016900 [Citrus x changshan-huyou]
MRTSPTPTALLTLAVIRYSIVYTYYSGGGRGAACRYFRLQTQSPLPHRPPFDAAAYICTTCAVLVSGDEDEDELEL